MENVILHLICDFDAKIFLTQNGVEVFSVETTNALSNEIDLVVNNIENFSFNVYPINYKKNSNLISYSADVNVLKNDLKTSSKQVKIFKLPENNFICIFKSANLEKDDIFEKYDKVEASENKIKFLKMLNTISKRGIVEVFDTTGDKPEFVEKYLVNISNVQISQEILKLLDFFENFQNGDYENAVKNFTYNLSEKLTNKTIKKFLGEYDKCLLVNYFKEPAVAILNFKKEQAKVFSATFENGLISNIFEVE